MVAAAPHGDAHHAALGPGFDAVLDRVLDERLQQEVGHRGRAKVLGHVELDAQAFAEAQLLQFDVRLQHAALFVERDEFAVAFAQRVAQQVA